VYWVVLNQLVRWCKEEGEYLGSGNKLWRCDVLDNLDSGLHLGILITCRYRNSFAGEGTFE
jgi:hypothetical protein